MALRVITTGGTLIIVAPLWGEGHTRLLKQMVNSQLELIRAKVNTTEEYLKVVALTFLDEPFIPTSDKIIGLLSVENRPMSFEEILSMLPNISQIRLSHILHNMTKAGDVKELKSPDHPSPRYECTGSKVHLHM